MKKKMQKGRVLLIVLMTNLTNTTFAMHQQLSPDKQSDLLLNNARYLKKLLKKEASGCYCNDLMIAEETLQNLFQSIRSEGSSALIHDIVGDEAFALAGHIAHRANARQKLLKACDDADIDRIKKITNDNPYVLQSYRDSKYFGHECTILHIAAIRSYPLDVIETLLQLGARPSAQVRYRKDSPLHFAKTREIAKLLLKHGANINQTASGGRTPLWWVLFSCGGGFDPSLAHYLIKHGADVNHVRDDGQTLLHDAMERNYGNVLKFLLKYPVNIYARNKENQSVLECAYPHFIKYFKPFNVKHISFTNGYKNCIWLLQDKAQQFKQLLAKNIDSDDIITARHQLAQLFLMLKKGKNEQRQDGIFISQDGYLFQNASFLDLSRIVGEEAVAWMQEYLNNYCADLLQKFVINAFHLSGDVCWSDFYLLCYDTTIAFSALKHLIKQDDNIAWFDSLANRGKVYDISGVDGDGNTLLHLAVVHKNKEAIKFLVEAGIDFAAKNNDGKTACDTINNDGNHELVCFVLEIIFGTLFKSSPNMVKKEYKEFLNRVSNAGGEDPLLLQVLRHNPEWVRQLLKSKARVNQKNTLGTSPLEYAVSQNDRNMVRLCLSYGALVDSATIVRASSTSLKKLLKKAFQKQQCCVCYEHPDFMADIPCSNYHQGTYLCAGCYDTLPVKSCPCCREPLLPYSI